MEIYDNFEIYHVAIFYEIEKLFKITTLAETNKK